MAERFLSMKQVAEHLGKSAKYLREQRCRGKFTLPLVRVNRMLGCRESIFNQWLIENERVS